MQQLQTQMGQMQIQQPQMMQQPQMTAVPQPQMMQQQVCISLSY